MAAVHESGNKTQRLFMCSSGSWSSSEDENTQLQKMLKIQRKTFKMLNLLFHEYFSFVNGLDNDDVKIFYFTFTFNMHGCSHFIASDL